MEEPTPDTRAVPLRVRDRLDPRPRLVRAVESWPAIAQIVVASAGAFAFAHFVLGHASPVLAGTVAVSSLGLVRDARPRRVAETVAGMLLGILVAELLLWAIGPGWWQLAVTLAVVLFLARVFSPQASFAIAAAIQGLIVLLFPLASTDAAWDRLVDGAIGGIAALLVTALIPRNPRAELLRDARALFAGADAAINAIVQGLRSGDRARADRGLEKARALDPLVRAWQESLDSASAVARISPFLRRRRSELDRYRRVLTATDLAVRNLRVIGRRAAYLLDDGVPRPVSADVLAGLGRGLALVGESLEDIGQESVAREGVRAIAAHLDPAEMLTDATTGENNLLVAMRPLTVDLLTACGVGDDDARAAIPRL
ncbi:FUSC family protein [Microbacterium sp. cx-55]|uniref:FUSC family protein n=1 Tax=Microbacterium sp. cx-55 TaxID=2875948 RepID=UPI001CBC7E08|nr:FUSC family protein [Microbacterium sp. cx-55]UGB34455.1 FUSC family protein [Microbacterium sp. cx-55]